MPVSGIERIRKGASHFRHVFQMIFQSLPLSGRLSVKTMCIIFFGHKDLTWISFPKESRLIRQLPLTNKTPVSIQEKRGFYGDLPYLDLSFV